MKKKTFAAIDVGSHELAMKIVEVSQQSGLKVIDHIRYGLDIGTESYKPVNFLMSIWRNSVMCFVSL